MLELGQDFQISCEITYKNKHKYTLATNREMMFFSTHLSWEFNQNFWSVVIPRLLTALIQLSVQLAKKITERNTDYVPNVGWQRRESKLNVKSGAKWVFILGWKWKKAV